MTGRVATAKDRPERVSFIHNGEVPADVGPQKSPKLPALTRSLWLHLGDISHHEFELENPGFSNGLFRMTPVNATVLCKIYGEHTIRCLSISAMADNSRIPVIHIVPAVYSRPNRSSSSSTSSYAGLNSLPSLPSFFKCGLGSVSSVPPKLV